MGDFFDLLEGEYDNKQASVRPWLDNRISFTLLGYFRIKHYKENTFYPRKTPSSWFCENITCDASETFVRYEHPPHNWQVSYTCAHRIFDPPEGRIRWTKRGREGGEEKRGEKKGEEKRGEGGEKRRDYRRLCAVASVLHLKH